MSIFPPDFNDKITPWEPIDFSDKIRFRVPYAYIDPPLKIKTNFDTAGVKFDEDKIRYDLVPPEAIEGLARVLTFGAKKYADRNWEKGMKWGRVFGALMRHSWAWWRGEDKDPETGYSHLEHALCCVAFLLTYEARKVGEDDRPRG